MLIQECSGKGMHEPAYRTPTSTFKMTPNTFSGDVLIQPHGHAGCINNNQRRKCIKMSRCTEPHIESGFVCNISTLPHDSAWHFEQNYRSHGPRRSLPLYSRDCPSCPGPLQSRSDLGSWSSQWRSARDGLYQWQVPRTAINYGRGRRCDCMYKNKRSFLSWNIILIFG